MHLTFQLSIKRIILLDKNLSSIKLVNILKQTNKQKVYFRNHNCFGIQIYPREISLFFKKKKKRQADLCQICLYYAKSLQKKERKRKVRMVHLPVRKLKKPKQTHNYGTDFRNKDPLCEV